MMLGDSRKLIKFKEYFQMSKFEYKISTFHVIVTIWNHTDLKIRGPKLLKHEAWYYVEYVPLENLPMCHVWSVLLKNIFIFYMKVTKLLVPRCISLLVLTFPTV